MKKVLLSMVAALGIIGVANAQVGTTQVNAGLGFSDVGTPLFAGVDYYLTDDISVGGEFSYRSTSINTRAVDNYQLVDAKFTYSGIGITANANYHFNKALNIPSEFDVYAGGSLGYYNWSSKISGVSGDFNYAGELAYKSGIIFSGQVGGRYFFNDKFAANLEFGVGSFSGGKIGITYRIK